MNGFWASSHASDSCAVVASFLFASSVMRSTNGLFAAWDDLKRRVPATGAVPQQPAFVELVTPQVQSVPECTFEVEGRRGKLRIQLKGASASDLASLSRVLWEVAS